MRGTIEIFIGRDQSVVNNNCGFDGSIDPGNQNGYDVDALPTTSPGKGGGTRGNNQLMAPEQAVKTPAGGAGVGIVARRAETAEAELLSYATRQVPSPLPLQNDMTGILLSYTTT